MIKSELMTVKEAAEYLISITFNFFGGVLYEYRKHGLFFR